MPFEPISSAEQGYQVLLFVQVFESRIGKLNARCGREIVYLARFRIVDEQLVFVIAVCGEVDGLCRIGIVGTRNGGYGLPLTEGRRLRQAFAFAVTYLTLVSAGSVTIT